MTKKPEYTNITLSTDKGTVILKQIKDDIYEPIEGNYRIAGPEGEYILISNIRFSIYAIAINLLFLLFLTVIESITQKIKVEEQTDGGYQS